MIDNLESNKIFNLSNKAVLFNGDCNELIKRIPDKSIDLIVTDPPYEIETSGGGLYKQPDKQYIKELNFIKDGFSDDILNECCRVMKKVNIYLFCSQKQIPKLLDYFLNNTNNKGHLLYKRKINWNLLCWHKTNPIPACGNKYLTDTEYILFFREAGVKIYGEFKTKFTYYVTPLNQKDKKIYGHPTIKPVDILQNLIINSSQENDVVFDPFAGSCSTGVSSILNNRKFIGFELDERHFNTSKERLKECENYDQLCS